MLFIIGLVIASVAVVVVRRMWLPDAALSPAPFGWMSEQWLTEHRASHPR